MQSPATARSAFFFEYIDRSWAVAFAVAGGYLLALWLSAALFPDPMAFFPASAIALAALFLEGLELWPVIYIAALIGSILMGLPPLSIATVPVAAVIQATLGAYLLRHVKIDPLFRRSRDAFWVIGVISVVALIAPTFNSLTEVIEHAVPTGTALLATLGLRYAGAAASLIIITPLLLRWFAKPQFSRRRKERIELFVVFALLIGIDAIIFTAGVLTVLGIPTIYFLFLPLFWIALRLRPRFVTLALFITAVFALGSLYSLSGPFAVSAFNEHLLQIDEFLIAFATIFLIITALEENRRLNSNIILSQIATLENALSRISSESSAKNDFIAVLAHELRNPLAPVVSAIDLMKLKGNRSPEELQMLTMMENRMEVVRRLLDDLLDISRITEGKLTLKKERVDLLTIVKRALLSTAHALEERHQSLTLKEPKEPLIVEGDAVRIEQVFSNLITNASKYSHSGGTITIVMERRGEKAHILVSDKGVGIEAEALEDIFTPFHQVEQGARSKKGLGIGLALVRSFVEMHGGSVVAESEGLGLGSRFSVLLPLAKKKDTQKTLKNRDHHRTHTAKEHCPHVLVVDDVEEAAWGIGRLLELKGCSVSYAFNGKQAIEEAVKKTPDIILLDVDLPDMDGYEVARILRARGFAGKLIALTGFSTQDARVKGREAGFAHYLIKPAGLADLKRVIPELV